MNITERVDALSSGLHLLSQLTARSCSDGPRLRAQFVQLTSALTRLEDDITEILSDSKHPGDNHNNNDTVSKTQPSFRPVLPTPKGKLLEIIESLRKASLGTWQSTAVKVEIGSGDLHCADVEDVACFHSNECHAVQGWCEETEATNDDKNSLLELNSEDAPFINSLIEDDTYCASSLPAPPPPPALPPAAPAPPPTLPPAVPPPPPTLPPLDTPHSTVQRYEPKIPLKPLFWTRVQFSSAQLRATDNVWKYISEPALEDVDRFVESFARRELTPRSRQESSVHKPRPSHVRPVTLLTGKRSQAVGIMLRSLSCGVCELCEAVRSGDVTLVDRGTLQALHDLQATEEELILINAHLTSDNPAPLDKPEMFLHELSEVPQFRQRLSCMLLSLSLPEASSALREKLSALKRVCHQLHHSREVSSILGLVLALGNVMNSGNKVRGHADGFHIDILPKLRDVKTADNSSNLLEYVVTSYVRHCENTMLVDGFPLPDPADIMTAAQVDFEQVQAEVDACHRRLQQMRTELASVVQATSRDSLEPFRSRMVAFIGRAETGHSELSSLAALCEQDFQSLVSYFCVTPPSGQSSVNPSYFFGLWSTFVVQFHDYWGKERRSLARERLRADKRKRMSGVMVKPLVQSGLKSRLKTKRQS